MRFKNLFIEPVITSKVGLEKIELENLAPIVGLIGKNGSGKTRMLDLLESQFESLVSLEKLEDNSIVFPPVELARLIEENNIIKNYITVKKSYEEIEISKNKQPNNQQIVAKQKELYKQYKNAQDQISKIDSPLTANDSLKYPERILKLNSQTSKRISNIKKNYFRRIRPSEILNLQEAIQKNTEEQILTFEKLIEELTENIDYNEIGIIFSSSLSYLKKLPHQLVYDDLQSQGNFKNFKKKVSYRRYITLKDAIRRFLNKNLEWDKKSVEQQLEENGIQSKIEGYWKLNGRPFNYNELSDGEKTLFAYALIFFLLIINPKLRIKESIIIIDEPEIHLHPDAEIILIDSIREFIKDKGQLWIATHSINILSHLNYDEIHIVTDGKVFNSSSQSLENALNQLLSMEERIFKLSTFMNSISNWTFLNFMSQCFGQPDVIEFNDKKDPQIELFIERLKAMNINQTILLDFGAGKGRLIRSLSQNKNLTSKISFCALEPIEEFHSDLTLAGVTKILHSYHEIRYSSFDFIVLCNVLHEIRIDEIVKTINKIIAGLKPNGYLIIIEAEILSKGEFIDGAGYLVFGPKELKCLFNLRNPPNFFQKSMRSNNIISTFLKKEELKPIQIKDLGNALKELETNTLRRIEDIRSNHMETNKVILGRNSAFYSQLYINSKLAQRILKQ